VTPRRPLRGGARPHDLGNAPPAARASWPVSAPRWRSPPHHRGGWRPRGGNAAVGHRHRHDARSDRGPPRLVGRQGSREPRGGGSTPVGPPRKGHVSGRGALTQAAWAATRTKPTSRAAPCRRLTTRLGTRRALVAGGHRMLGMAWHGLSNPAGDADLGRDACDRGEAQASRLNRMRKLEALGLQVILEPVPSVSEASSFS